MGMMRVIKPGALSTLQDLGRVGHQQFGVPVNGVMDSDAHRRANALVGNAPSAATLECTLQGPTVRFDADCLIAITGGDLDARVDDKPFPLDCAVLLRAGVVLQFGACRSGARAYLAVSGGFDVPCVMGSRSTFVRGGYGGFSGRALQRDDRVPLASAAVPHRGLLRLMVQAGVPFTAASVVPWSTPAASPLAASDEASKRVLRFVAGPQWDAFSATSHVAFTELGYKIDTRSDRMGYRLKGEPLALLAPLEMISEGTPFGTIQVPPDGQPIVLMADRQTAGGYPKIAYVARVDLPLLAQAMPEDVVRFSLVTLAQAQQLAQQRAADLARFAATAAAILQTIAL